MAEKIKHETLAAALAAFQAEIPHIAKGNEADVKAKSGASFKYSYADLTDVTKAAMPLLSKHGLAFTAAPSMTDRGFVLAYMLMHEAGDSVSGEYPLPSNGSPQDVGSAITYARRYALCAVTGVAPGGDDDDGAKAQQSSQQPAQVKAPNAWRKLIADATTMAELNGIYQNAHAEGWANDDVMKALTARKEALHVAPDPAAA